MNGRIILLNGTSSSGKSTLAAALQQALVPEPWLHVPIDAFFAMLPYQAMTAGLTPEQVQAATERMVGPLLDGFHRSVAALADAGNHLIVDAVQGGDSLRRFLHVIRGSSVYLVAVRCRLDEAERRERARGDRKIGMAAEQFPQIHAHGAYDVEVDTAAMPPDACARHIVKFLASGVEPMAGRRLRDGPGP
jgi:chloramphenicol 3-O phosphotransferase